MNRIILSLVIASLVAVTLCVCVFKPKMHKMVMVYPSDYVVVENAAKSQPGSEFPVQINKTQSVQTVKKVEPEKKQTTTINKPIQTQKTERKSVSSPIGQNQVKTVVSKPKVEQKVEVVDAPIQETKTEIQLAQQEIILWNKWRSNLQNQIMNDVKLPLIKEGTVFKFTFDVDKYGRVSNVRTWSLDAAYTPYAIQYIAPIIRSYQGRSILEFPTGSNRVTTTVEGGWKIAKTAKYSTPADFSDTEKVNR